MSDVELDHEYWMRHALTLAKLEQFLTQIKAIDDLVKSFDELDTEN